jgi:protoporphyrinogen/coproporphyrinogen III oxidase
MSADLVLPRKKRSSATEDESLADFVRRRLGQEALERMAQPMIGGIYTADPEELSLRATMPRFLDMEQKHRSLILAIWRQGQKTRNSQNHEAAGPRYGLFVSLDQGMVRLVEELRKRLPPDSIHLNTQVSALRKNPSGRQWILDLSNGTQLEADAVCLALAAFQSADLVQGFDRQLAARLRSIRYASTATVNLGYPLEDIPGTLEGFGFVVPAVEKREILACTFSHMKFSGRAPRNHALLRAFVGGALQPRTFDYEDREIIQIVRQNLRELLGIEKPPMFAFVERHAQAMAQYRVGHLDLVEEIETLTREHPSLQLAGNGFTGIGIPDCIRRGEECASRLLEALEGSSQDLPRAVQHS